MIGSAIRKSQSKIFCISDVMIGFSGSVLQLLGTACGCFSFGKWCLGGKIFLTLAPFHACMHGVAEGLILHKLYNVRLYNLHNFGLYMLRRDSLSLGLSREPIGS